MNPEVSTNIFNLACVNFGVILTSDEVLKLKNEHGNINYVDLSRKLGLHSKSIEKISGINPLTKINKLDLEQVFQQNKVPLKKVKMSRRQKVLDLCFLVDK
jgi:hypothetical protein